MLDQLKLESVKPSEYRAMLESAVKNGEVSAEELSYMHVKVEHVDYNEKGKKLSKPSIVKHSMKDWVGIMLDYYKGAGYDVEVLYDVRETSKKSAKGKDKADAIEPETK